MTRLQTGTLYMAIRARRVLSAGLWQDALAVVSLVAPVAMLVLAMLNIAENVRELDAEQALRRHALDLARRQHQARQQRAAGEHHPGAGCRAV